MTTPNVPRIHAKHALQPLYDWLDKYVTNATPASSGPTVDAGIGDGESLIWDNTAKAWQPHGTLQTMSYQISQTDLLAHTTQHLILHPGVGYTNSIQFFMVAVQATVTTGGTIKMQNGGVDVAGASATINNGDTPGTHYIKFTTNGSADFGFGDDITLALSGFAGAGALNCFITTAAGPF